MDRLQEKSMRVGEVVHIRQADPMDRPGSRARDDAAAFLGDAVAGKTFRYTEKGPTKSTAAATLTLPLGIWLPSESSAAAADSVSTSRAHRA